MSKQEDDLIYDDEKAVKFILNHFPNELRGKYNEDDIEYFLDIIYEYYDEKGLIDEESDEIVEIDEDEMLNFICKNIKKDKDSNIKIEDVPHFISGEFEYCKSIGICED